MSGIAILKYERPLFLKGVAQKCVGDPGRLRTSDLRFRKPSLYPAELRDRMPLHTATAVICSPYQSHGPVATPLLRACAVISPSSGPDAGEETVDFAAQRLGLRSKFRRRSKHLSGGCFRRSDAFGHAQDILRYLAGPRRRLLHISRDFLRRGSLLFHSGRDRGGNFIDRGNGGGDVVDVLRNRAGLALNGTDLSPDILGGFGGLRRE